MANKTRQKIQKLKKKKVWPSVLFMLIFLMIFVMLIFMGFGLAIHFLIGNKLNEFSKETKAVQSIIDSRMCEGEDIITAVRSLQEESNEIFELYVVNREGKEVIATGRSKPDFKGVIQFDGDQLYVLVADSEAKYYAQNSALSIIGMPLGEMLLSPFRERPEAWNQEVWMQQPIIHQKYWLRLPMEHTMYQVYAKCELTVSRQAMMTMELGGIFVLFLLLLPLIYLLVNLISTVRMQRQLTQILYMDPVTGGHNWYYFNSKVSYQLSCRSAARRSYALVDLHMMHYQNYCACYGTAEGENLLEAINEFLSTRLARREYYARHEGADFALLFECPSEEDCTRRLRTMMAELPGLKPDKLAHFRAGVYMIAPAEQPDRFRIATRKHVDVDQMYSYAMAARTTASGQNRTQISYFNQLLLEQQNWERWVEDEIDTALISDEFKVYLQPKYNPANNRLVGAEALVRWISPERGMITPNRFIPIFEANGGIMKLDDYMISNVAKLQAEWSIEGRKTVPISVNVSRVHFSVDNLAEHIRELVDAYGPKHDLIELEVTESAFFDDKDSLVQTVEQLKAYGFSVSMDDFGAGYSSLNSLKDIRLDVLKLDGDFFRGDDSQGRGRIVVQEAIMLARALNMRVVAEGIEEKEQADFLASIGCDMIQGYYYARPMPVDEFVELMERDA